MMLPGLLLHIEQFASPEMSNGAIGIPTEHVVHGLVPILAERIAALCPHRRPELCRVTEIMAGVVVACRRQQLEMPPAALARPRLQPRDRRLRNGVSREALVGMEDTAVQAVESVRAAGTRLVAFRPVHEAVEQDAGMAAKKLG